jgi:Zn-dependent protease
VNGSIEIGRAFGIPVRIHATFLLLVALLYLFVDGALATLGLLALVFGCVLLHELGHSLVARGFGLRVADITLWPLGGMARMSEIPENARIEALIAIAGPAVNFALAGLALVALVLGAAFGLEPAALPERLAWFFLTVNLIQGGFNLVPAFPMDGGRLLRAFLARKRDWLAATELAVRVGRWVAGLLLVGSLWLMLSRRGLCLMPLVAVFVWFEGTRELWSVRLRHGVSPFGTGPFGGAAPARDVHATGTTPAPSAHEEPLERGSARRPRSWEQALPRDGFSEEEIRRLEAHRGPLRRPPPAGESPEPPRPS